MSQIFDLKDCVGKPVETAELEFGGLKITFKDGSFVEFTTRFDLNCSYDIILSIPPEEEQLREKEQFYRDLKKEGYSDEEISRTFKLNQSDFTDKNEGL
jgi:hypothetical protein